MSVFPQTVSFFFQAVNFCKCGKSSRVFTHYLYKCTYGEIISIDLVICPTTAHCTAIASAGQHRSFTILWPDHIARQIGDSEITFVEKERQSCVCIEGDLSQIVFLHTCVPSRECKIAEISDLDIKKEDKGGEYGGLGPPLQALGEEERLYS